jgi:hypothetical protein
MKNQLPRIIGFFATCLAFLVLWQEAEYNLPNYSKYFGFVLGISGVILLIWNVDSWATFWRLLGQERISKSLGIAFQFSIIISILIFYFFENQIKLNYEQSNLTKNGIITKAKIYKRFTYTDYLSKRNKEKYKIGVTFQSTTNQIFSIEKEVERSEYLVFENRDSVDVIYAKDKPEVLYILFFPSYKKRFGK